MKNRFIKTAVAATVLSALFAGSTVAAGLTTVRSAPTPTMKGYAPYLPSVGSRFVNKRAADKGVPFMGDIIEIPTYLFDQKFYAYRDGNDETPVGESSRDNYFQNKIAKQDFDQDNANSNEPSVILRNRKGQLFNQKVSVRWYVVTAQPGYIFADEIDGFMDEVKDLTGQPLRDAFVAWENDSVKNPEGKKIVKNWEDVNKDVDMAEVSGNTYYVPMGNGRDESLAFRIPPEAAGKRVGFIITPESATGDPARGVPLKVADLNFFWGQGPTLNPGDVCEVAPKDPTIADKGVCDTDNPALPYEPNPDNGGGVVALRQYMVNIRWSMPEGYDPALPYASQGHGTGIPSFDSEGRPNDPIVGEDPRAPFPVTDQIYYAEIAILTPKGEGKVPRSLPVNQELYRLLNNNSTDNERDSVTWELAAHTVNDLAGEVQAPAVDENGDFVPTLSLNWGENKATAGTSYSDARTKGSRFIGLECPQAALDNIGVLGGLTVEQVAKENDCNPFTGHAFITQLNDPEANNFWEQNGATGVIPGLQEKSEQRMSMQVSFGIDMQGLDLAYPNTNP